MSPEAPESHERKSLAQRPTIHLNLRNDPIPHLRQTPTRSEAEDSESGGESNDEAMNAQHEDEEESSMVTTGGKRARDDDDFQLEQTVKAQKLWQSVGRPKAKDYDDVTQEILSVAIAVYRCLISTDTPFPDHSKELEFVKIAWNVACKKADMWLEMNPELVKMVRARNAPYQP
jgi:hypothetical protein